MLLRVATTFVDLLERHSGCPQLRTFEDWHEHDGYHLEGSDAGWNDLRAAVADETAFRASSPEDDHVRRAWLPDDASFYLRWLWYPAEPAPVSLAKRNDPDEGGDIDLTARPSVITDAREALSAFELASHVMRAEEFFTWRWAG